MRYKDSRQSTVHNQQACFDAPDGDHLHLLRDDDQLGPILTVLDGLGSEDNAVGGVDEVRRRVGQDLDDDQQDRICYLMEVSITAMRRGGTVTKGFVL